MKVVSSRRFQRTFAISENVETALTGLIENEIGDDVTLCKCSFKEFAREEAPIAGEREVRGFERHEIGRKLSHEQLSFQRGDMLGRARQACPERSRRVTRSDLKRVERADAE